MWLGVQYRMCSNFDPTISVYIRIVAIELKLVIDRFANYKHDRRRRAREITLLVI
jgi:hypothetical protein